MLKTTEALIVRAFISVFGFVFFFSVLAVWLFSVTVFLRSFSRVL